MIGLSISKCFCQMALGEVDPDSVEKVIGRTSARDEDAWEYVIDIYRGSFWGSCADEAERLFREFLKAGKIEQPKITENWVPNNTSGIWVESENQIEKIEA